VGDVLIHHTAASSDHVQAARIRANSAFMEEAEESLRPVLTGLLATIAKRDDLPPGLRMVVDRVTDPSQQFDLFLQIAAFLGAIVSVVMGLGPIETQRLKNDLLTLYTDVPLSPADLADMVERNIIMPGTGEQEAAKSGMSPANFDLLVKDTGEPYGIEQALNLLRRGLITQERFTEVLYYSRVRNEFLPDVLDLAHDTMSQGDAIEAALKEIIPNDQAADLFAKAGGLPDQFNTLLAAAGNPVGVEHAVMMWMHGVISEQELQTIVAHSRINPMFYDVVKTTGLKWLSVIQIELGLKAGTVTPDDATRWLTQDGYPPDQIAAFVMGASAGKTAAHKQLNESQITELYEAGFFTADQASAELQALGYDAGETPWILQLYEEKRKIAMAQAAVNQVRKVYLARRVDDTAATTMLDGLGIDPGARDQYLAVWKVEQESELKELTAAQIGSAFKKGIVDDNGALIRWVEMGYTNADAAILLALYGGNPPAGSPAAIAAASTPASP